MLVIAFGCCHFASPVTQIDLQDRNYGYENHLALAMIIKRVKPDLVINLGDWEEDYYESSGWARRLCPELAVIEAIRIKGNHDKTGLPFFECDGVLYEHGYKKTYTGGARIVHAHTHKPQEGWPLDVGSVAFSGTYGIINDGVAKLVYIND